MLPIGQVRASAFVDRERRPPHSQLGAESARPGSKVALAGQVRRRETSERLVEATESPLDGRAPGSTIELGFLRRSRELAEEDAEVLPATEVRCTQQVGPGVHVESRELPGCLPKCPGALEADNQQTVRQARVSTQAR